MCRNIRPLFNVDPPAGRDEIRDAALQFIRKISGRHRPSRANEAAFEAAVSEVADACTRLLSALVTTARPRDGGADAARARARSQRRFGVS